jgi:signal transduction histidine kinase
MYRGLTVIEERAASLNRFLQAYQQLMRLPAPHIQLLSLTPLLEQVTHLETRLPIALHPGPPIHLRADADQLQQLLINLIRNAVEAALSSTAGARPEVSVAWSTTPTSAVVQVRDNGMGLMNPANLFVPFYTTKPEGSGIGLVLAQQIATAHKGSVTLYNNPDAAGCIAELRLPLEQS